MRFQALPDSPVGISLAATTQQDLASLSNGILVRLSSFITNSTSVDYTLDSPQGVLAGGTLLFVPGDLIKSIPVDLTNLQRYGILRVTLTNPSDGQLGGQARVYYVAPLNNPNEPPVLAFAHFPDENLLYWSDVAASLLHAASVTGPWNPLSNAPSPFQMVSTGQQEFFRLTK